jgi:hemerythrin
MAIEWNDNLVTGNDSIDEQHKELFRRVDTLLEACNQRKGKEEVHNLLRFLGDYVKTHFAMEENLQKKSGYPHYRAHKEQHDDFIRVLEALVQQFNAEGATLPLVIQTNQSVVNWLINHINVKDKDLAAYLRTSS